MEGMRISKNGRRFRVSISLEEENVVWLVEAFEDFYWRKGGKSWGKHTTEKNRKLWMTQT